MEKIEYNVELIGVITQSDITQEVDLMDKLINAGLSLLEATKLLCNYNAYEAVNACVSKKGYLTMVDIYSAMEQVHVFF